MIAALSLSDIFFVVSICSFITAACAGSTIADPSPIKNLFNSSLFINQLSYY